MTAFFENIRKIMGCRPSVNSKIYKSNQPIYFADSPVNQIGKRIEVQPLQSDNVIFPANTSLFTLCFATALNNIWRAEIEPGI
ncbi:MAG: hypothetical protein OIN66_16900 [Candidatus Methanoperedens sp.]|nr:hypothetical protein [Candidatus Methanoperedens sp.]